ncbi:MAG: type II toxin-antitoxin system RelE/ParE family toxin [Bryobacteraceae bacterium]
MNSGFRPNQKPNWTFWLLARYPQLGRSRDYDLGLGIRSLPIGDYLIVHRIDENNVVLILHILHGSRDIAAIVQS